jgi:hypothetical protein
VSDELIDVLTAAEKLAEGATKIPGPVGDVASIVHAVLTAGTALARAGKNPVIEIPRILASEPSVNKVLEERERAIRDKFGAKSEPPPTPAPPDTVPPSSDPYDEDESE